MTAGDVVLGRGRSSDALQDGLSAKVPAEPMFSPWLPIFCSLLYTALYIAPFYLSATLRHTPLNSRDAPACIRARVRAVGWTCLACTAITVTVLVLSGAAATTTSSSATSTPSTLLRLLGLYPISITNILRVLLLTATLFSCSLYEALIVDGGYRQLFSPNAFKETLWTDIRGFRNLVIAPASEELVFRSLTLPLYLLAGVSPGKIIFTTPLVFGLAHAHHLVEFLQSFTPASRTNEGTPWWAAVPANVWVSGLLRTVFQFGYTSLFGFFAAFVFLRTGSLWGCVLVHAFCNFMGLPRVWGRVGSEDVDVLEGEQNSNGSMGDDKGQLGSTFQETRRPKKGVAWTVAYYALVPLGMFGFYHWLWVLTESENALVQFG